jgi:polyhydroxyalkanoate synthesis repressor PhaR
MNDIILLKKYSNRRLYDTEKSQYVTIENVSDMIKKDREVKIIDAQTKEDVTAFILSQIIMEEAKKKNFLLPVPVLHLIIRYGDNALGDFLDKYLHKTIQNYLKYKKAFDEQMKQWIDMGMNMSETMSSAANTQPPIVNLMKIFAPSKLNKEANPSDPKNNTPSSDEKDQT